MKTRAMVMVGISVLVLSGATAGVVSQGGVAFAGSHGEAKALKQARDLAGKAGAALAKGKLGPAIAMAEAAVSLNPQMSEYRALLGVAYLKTGRFVSARQAFADALTLAPGNGRVALNLALTQIATGEWDGARQTLDANTQSIPASDRGLAMALAGDPGGAVDVLTNAARSPDADAKTRQNLALAFALAGRWQEAKTTVSIDLAPADVDARIIQWAAFAKPKSASDQVATLLGVTPVQDGGQPVALALNQQPTTSAMAANTAEPIDSYMPGKVAEVAEVAAAPVAAAPVEVAMVPETDTVVAASPSVAVGVAAVRFMPRQEVVQIVPQRAARMPTRPVVAIAASSLPRVVAKGGYYVQLGAYENASVAKDAWARVVRRNAAFSRHTPQGMGVTTNAGSFYRLSVGGFARADAAALCSSYRAQGGNCFVRQNAGDKVARWATGPQLASR